MRTWPNFQALEADTSKDWLGDLDERAQGLLIDLRGGCRCFISPPCSACTEPITEDEAKSIGLIEEPKPSIDYMSAVRAMCK